MLAEVLLDLVPVLYLRHVDGRLIVAVITLNARVPFRPTILLSPAAVKRGRDKTPRGTRGPR